MIQQDGEVGHVSFTVARQAVVLVLHTMVALLAWALLMAGGYALNRPQIAQELILVLSFLIPLAVGYGFNRFRQDPLAGAIWMIGMIWFLIVALWVIDMPTGPNACDQCDATDKMTRTFFSFPSPGGLLDNDGPFLATWPTAALIGYSMGARLSLRRKSR
jgi:hypothetical protein